MNTKALIISIVILTGIFSYFSVKKIRSAAKKKYTVIVWEKYDLCFLVAPEYEITKTEKLFDYKAGKNSGSFSLEFRGLNKEMNTATLGDFEAAYSKEIDYRNFEYLIAQNVVLLDHFDFAKKNIPNLLPVRNNCSKYLERFPIKFKM